GPGHARTWRRNLQPDWKHHACDGGTHPHSAARKKTRRMVRPRIQIPDLTLRSSPHLRLSAPDHSGLRPARNARVVVQGKRIKYLFPARFSLTTWLQPGGSRRSEIFSRLSGILPEAGNSLNGFSRLKPRSAIVPV